MNKSAPFSRLAILLLVVCTTGLFALSVLLRAFPNSEGATGNNIRPSSHSRSAVGHMGFYELLRRSGLPVQRGIGDVITQTGRDGVLIVAEPDRYILIGQNNFKFTTVRSMLLVLPKWGGLRDRDRRGWIAKARELSPAVPDGILSHIVDDSEIVRVPPPPDWRINEIGLDPQTRVTTQLITSRKLRPIVATANGILLGEVKNQKGRTIWVLSDPDIIENHGLLQGANASFALNMINALLAEADADGPIVFDETVHGFSSTPSSPLQIMVKFPFGIVTGLAAIAIILLLWAATGRFGAPRTEQSALNFGKTGLIANSARLIERAGHQAMALQRYLRMTVRDVATQLHAPAANEETQTLSWLDHIGKSRGADQSCSEIISRADGIEPHSARALNRLFACVRDIHTWKREVLHGPSARRRDR